MGALELEYAVTHPYPRNKIFTIITCVLVVLILPVLIIVNVVTVGYELVPSLQSDFRVNRTDSNSPRLPQILRRTVPLCEPKDIGRDDTLRLSPSLFEYTVLTSWRTNSSDLRPEDEGRVEYRGGSFHHCSVYEILFDHSSANRVQTVTVVIRCPDYPVRVSMEARVHLSWDPSQDVVFRYYGYDMDSQRIHEPPRDYRRSVFGVLDILSTDSLAIMHQQHLATPVSLLRLSADVTSEKRMVFNGGTITYQNGTSHELGDDDVLSDAEIYRASISNIMLAVYYAVELDLGNPSPNNIFLNPSAINDTFSSNTAPAQVDPSHWVGDDAKSWKYGNIVPPYQTWAQMLRVGLPETLPIGNLTGQPSDSKMLTSYLCPIYQLKPTGTLLANVFIGTTTMFLSVWAAWMALSAMIAKRMENSCMVCSCGNPIAAEKGHALHGSHHHHHGGQVPSVSCRGNHTSLNRDSEASATQKGQV